MVLIVASDPTMQQYLLRCVSNRGCQAVVVPSLANALDRLARDSFSVTVIDLDSQSVRESEYVSVLKLQPGDPGTIIALTNGNSRAPSVSGVDRFVDKASFDTDLDRELQSRLAVLPPGSKPSANKPTSAAQVPHEMALWQGERMQEVRAIVEEAAGVDVTVLITGETGTGKDVVARAIHALSWRRSAPYVKVNCAAVPRELLETELFGHERGAFTGAHKLKLGKFEAANNGTIFLDEIGDLHPALQAKLLHVLQDGEFSRVGGKSTLRVNVRVLAATNQDLEQAVAQGRFREDLYYRLNVIQIVVPPLRERMEEVPAFVDYFVDMYTKMFRRQPYTVPPAIMERLMRHRYPGNVRELENLIKRMIVLGDPFLARGTSSTGRSTAVTRPSSSAPSVLEVPLKEASHRAALAAERDIIARVLADTGGNRVQAARALRISYRALLYKIKRSGLPRVRPSLSPVLGSVPHPPETRPS